VIVNESDIRFDKILEDINSILNTGEVPSLFEEDEKDMILGELKEIEVKKGNKKVD